MRVYYDNVVLVYLTREHCTISIRLKKISERSRYVIFIVMNE